MTDFEIRRHDGQLAAALMDALADAYIDGYADDPDIGHSIYARDEFVERTTRQAQSEGFVLLTAHDMDGALVGFSFGLPFAPGRWWAAERETQPPDELVRATKFAVIELVVLPVAHGVGLSTRLMNALLLNRPEAWATLLADQTGHARLIYDRWGWTPTSTIRPAPDVPPLDVLVLPLQGQ